jgi:Mrp family chromosome partitioning ATPase
MLSENAVRDFTLLAENIKQTRETHGTKIITVTSAAEEEGCSTVAYFLTLLLSQSVDFASNGGSRPNRNGVLLMDANIEKPILHQIFGVDQDKGLTKVWLNGFSKNGKLQNVYRGTIHLLTACSSRDRWMSIVQNGALRKLMSELRSQFEYVIIDAPPVIGHPETLALSRISDGVLLVLKANKTPSSMIEEAKLRLRRAEVNILGAVLNDNKSHNGDAGFSRN